MKFDEFKPDISNSLDMKASAINSKKSSSSYDQPSADIAYWSLLKSPYFYSHESQLTKDL